MPLLSEHSDTRCGGPRDADSAVSEQVPGASQHSSLRQHVHKPERFSLVFFFF